MKRVFFHIKKICIIHGAPEIALFRIYPTPVFHVEMSNTASKPKN